MSSRKVRFGKFQLWWVESCPNYKNIYFSHLTQKRVIQVLASLWLFLWSTQRHRHFQWMTPPFVKASLKWTRPRGAYERPKWTKHAFKGYHDSKWLRCHNAYFLLVSLNTFVFFLKFYHLTFARSVWPFLLKVSMSF